MSIQTIGQAIRWEEAPHLLKGKGRYVDDMRLPNEARSHALRSPQAHARIVAINTTAARAAPGVLVVLTNEDLFNGQPQGNVISHTALHCGSDDIARRLGCSEIDPKPSLSNYNGRQSPKRDGLVH